MNIIMFNTFWSCVGFSFQSIDRNGLLNSKKGSVAWALRKVVLKFENNLDIYSTKMGKMPRSLEIWVVKKLQVVQWLESKKLVWNNNLGLYDYIHFIWYCGKVDKKQLQKRSRNEPIVEVKTETLKKKEIILIKENTKLTKEFYKRNWWIVLFTWEGLQLVLNGMVRQECEASLY